MERHDEQKLDLLFPQLAFDSTDQGPSNSLPMMVRIDAEPIDFRADGAVPFDHQQTTRSSINARNPSFQDFRLDSLRANHSGKRLVSAFRIRRLRAASFSRAMETSMPQSSAPSPPAP